jgi:guanylate kinase
LSKQPQLIVISAPSGAGKTTLCSRLLRDFRELSLSVSTTTRAPRGQEKDGVEYHFVTREKFQKMIDANRFAEWAEVHGNRYGTSLDAIDLAFGAGRSLLLDIDVQGAESLRQAYGKRALTVFIAPPSLEELERRLRSRGTDPEDTIQRRMRNARDEMAHLERFDHVVINDTLDHAYEELKAIVEERLHG